MIAIFKTVAIIMAFASFLCLYRGLIGPSAADKIIVINTIGTKVVVILSLFSAVFHDGSYLDMALVYAMLSYIVTISVAKYKTQGKIF